MHYVKLDPEPDTESSQPRNAPSHPVKPRLGVALGGGSARGYAHFGALANLERNGYVPDVIAGTSFGAVVGALYSTGRDLKVLMAEADGMRRRDVFPHIADFGLHRAALFDGHRLEAYFDRLLEGRHFSDLEHHLVVVTTDIDSGEQVLLSEGSLAVALRASTSIPGIFAPVALDGRRLIDGGIGTPVPLDSLSGFDLDVAIGIGAGMEARDSHAIRFVRLLLNSDTGKRIQRAAAARRPRNAIGRLGRALAIAAEGWTVTAGDEVVVTEQGNDIDAHRSEKKLDASRAAAGVAAAGIKRCLEVHTRPPISWLNFHRAAEAMRAGDEALDQLMPRLKLALAQP